MGYRIIDHTADIGIEGWGKTKEELFIEMAKALTSLLIEGEISSKETYIFNLKADNIEELLHDWLSELNYVFIVKQKIFKDFNILKLNDCELKIEGLGETIDLNKHELKLEIKGITYHQFKVENKKDKWYAKVFLDL